jgi:hypothetical protein
VSRSSSGVLGLAAVVLLGATLAACGGGERTPGSIAAGNGGAPSAGGGGGAVTFSVTVAFTGTDPLQGSFSDAESGRGIPSCATYATTAYPVVGWSSPIPPAGTQVAGKTLSFAWMIGSPPFHGPGAYPTGTGVVGPALVVGADTFFGSTSTVTINADGSGSGSFTNLSTGTGGTESGTVNWTCSG